MKEYQIRVMQVRPGDVDNACGNCFHCISNKDEKSLTVRHRCRMDGHNIGYVAFFEEKCKKWKRGN